MNALLWLGMIGFQCNESTKIRFCPDGWRHLIFDILCHSRQRPPFSAIFPANPYMEFSQEFDHIFMVLATSFSLSFASGHTWRFPFCPAGPVIIQSWMTMTSYRSHDLGIPHDFRNPLDTGPIPGACGIALAYDGADSTAPGMNGWKGARSQTLVMGIGSFGLMMWDTHCSKPGMIDDWIFPPTVRCCTVRCWGCFIMGCATWILKLLESKGIPLFTWIAESVIIQNFSTG